MEQRVVAKWMGGILDSEETTLTLIPEIEKSQLCKYLAILGQGNIVSTKILQQEWVWCDEEGQCVWEVLARRRELLTDKVGKLDRRHFNAG